MLKVEAIHTALDGVTIIISLISVVVAAKPSNSTYTYGYARAEVVSAFISLLALMMLCAKLFISGVRRLVKGGGHVEGKVVFIAEGITLMANVTMAIVLSKGGSSSLNIRALRAHIVADSIENLFVLIAGGVMWAFPLLSFIDPLLTVVIVLFIVIMNSGIARETVRALLQGGAEGVDLKRLRIKIKEVEGVVKVGRVHVWTLTSGIYVGSAVVYGRIVRKDVEAILREVGCVDVTVAVCEESEMEEDGEWEDDEEDVEIYRGVGMEEV